MTTDLVPNFFLPEPQVSRILFVAAMVAKWPNLCVCVCRNLRKPYKCETQNQKWIG